MWSKARLSARTTEGCVPRERDNRLRALIRSSSEGGGSESTHPRNARDSAVLLPPGGARIGQAGGEREREGERERARDREGERDKRLHSPLELDAREPRGLGSRATRQARLQQGPSRTCNESKEEEEKQQNHKP